MISIDKSSSSSPLSSSSSPLSSLSIINRCNIITDQDELLLHHQSSLPIFSLARDIAIVELEKEIIYRLQLFKEVKAFNHLDEEDLNILARSVEIINYKTNDYLIVQDEIGDALYILDDGHVQVTRTDTDDNGEIYTKKLAQLGPHRLFGEVALLTDEPRNASIYVISDTARCLKLTRDKFQEVIGRNRIYLEKNKTVLSNNVIQTLPFLQTLPPSMKASLANQFSLVSIAADTYILREGTVGNNFYILILGSCLVTANSNVGDNNSNEVELAVLSTGDFFGETALIDPLAKRTANIVALENCTCLTLSRQGFENVLNVDGNKKWFTENTKQTTKETIAGDKSYAKYLSKFRRISTLNPYNKLCSLRATNIIARITKFMIESIYNNLYSRLYRRIVLHEERLLEYGQLVAHIYRTSDNRDEFIQTIQVTLESILRKDNDERNYSECCLVNAIMCQRNNFRNVVCRTMPHHMFRDLCLKAELIKAQNFKYIVEGEKRGENIYVVLRGCVRVFAVKKVVAGKSLGLELELDVGPGEVFGEAVVKGASTKHFSAFAMTDCDILIFSKKALIDVQDTSISEFDNEQKTQFLKSIPSFSDWKLINLFIVGKNLRMETFGGGVNLVVKNATSSRTLCCLQKYDYLGESGLINSEIRKKNDIKITEQFSAICDSNCTLLILEPEHYNLIDIETVKMMYTVFIQKNDFRQERLLQSKAMDKKMKMLSKRALTGVEKAITSLIRPSSSDCDLSRSEHSRLPSISKSKTNPDNQQQVTNEKWDVNDSNNSLLEAHNMIFYGIYDPIMITGTIKGSERAKQHLLQSIPTTIEDVTIRYNGKLASSSSHDGFKTLLKKEQVKNQTASTSRSESSIDTADSLFSRNSPQHADPSFITDDARNFLLHGLKGL